MNRVVARSVFGLSALVLAACSDTPTEIRSSSAESNGTTPYIVLLRDTVTDAASVTARIAAQLPSLRTTATVTAPGVSARVVELEPQYDVLSDLHAAVLHVNGADADRLRADPRVLVAEPVRMMQATAVTTAATPSWALDRIDQAALPLDGKATRFGNDGAGVRIAIFDTGIRWTHSEISGRVAGGFDAFTGTAKTSGDAHGHGTYVASLAAGRTYGVASSATLLDVRVLNAQGSGSSLELAKATDWVIAEKKRVAGPMVVNMSLGFSGISTVVDALVDRLRAAGITVVVAAGNDAKDACGSSPARAPGAITVASITRGAVDTRSTFSNGGVCVDLSAPGEAVVGAGAASDAGLVMGSGTSMSSPFTAGAAAEYLTVNRTGTPDAVAAWLIAEATTGKVQGLMAGTPNRILTLRRLPTAGTTTPAPAPAPAPTPTPAPAPSTGTGMSLTSSCTTARVCTVDASVPASVSAADAPTIVYTWTLARVATISGTNLRRQIISFGGPATLDITVTAKKGTTVVGTAAMSLVVK